jgi:hypothetical protein
MTRGATQACEALLKVRNRRGVFPGAAHERCQHPRPATQGRDIDARAIEQLGLGCAVSARGLKSRLLKRFCQGLLLQSGLIVEQRTAKWSIASAIG